MNSNIQLTYGKYMSPTAFFFWRTLQVIVWLVGLFIFISLIFYPSLGLLVFWNILIPVAPLLFVVAVGVWRNVCPLATTNLLPRHWGLSKRKKLTAQQLGVFNLIGILALFIIIPLRHAIFNRNGLATASLIIFMVLAGMVLGLFFEWKSAWCSGLCPVHPVEKLYGSNTRFSFRNAHCDQCQNCVIPCPDSTPNMHPAANKKNLAQELSGILIIGGLPGFIWGWFHEADQTAPYHSAIQSYILPLIGYSITLLLYVMLKFWLPAKWERKLISFFAASGVSCYYWYRIPALFGFGKFADDGLLVNLQGVIPAWTITLMIYTSTLFFFYWIVYRKPNNKSWVIRPPFAEKVGIHAN